MMTMIRRDWRERNLLAAITAATEQFWYWANVRYWYVDEAKAQRSYWISVITALADQLPGNSGGAFVSR